MLEFQEHRLRLPQNFLNQSFTRAHTGEIISPELRRRDIFIEDHRCSRAPLVGLTLPAPGAAALLLFHRPTRRRRAPARENPAGGSLVYP
jgi:hypothetical protein